METEILTEIRDSEKKADDIVERGKREQESILHEATINSSKLLAEKENELSKLQEKKLMDFREKSRLSKEEKISESRSQVKQIKSRAEKNIAKAVDFVLKKFEEMI